MSDDTWIEVGGGSIRGGLVAVGTAETPIVIQGSSAGRGAWAGISVYAAEEGSRLSHVTISGGGRDEDADQAVLRISTPQATLQVDHTTLTNGGAHGLALVYGAQLREGSGSNVITGNDASPIFTDFLSLGSLTDGIYTGNGVDEVEVEAGIGGVSTDTTMRGLSVPWHLSDALVDVTAKLTIEPGNRLIFATASTRSPAFEVSEGGSVVIDGGSEADRIVLTGEAGAPSPAWGGITFLTTAHASTLRYVTIEGAGSQNCGTSYGACIAGDSGELNAAVCVSKTEAQSALPVTIEQVTFGNLGTKTYAIDRDYCGGSATDFANNSFVGPMFCGMTDTLPCDQSDCDSSLACCDHAFSCVAPPTAQD